MAADRAAPVAAAPAAAAPQRRPRQRPAARRRHLAHGRHGLSAAEPGKPPFVKVGQQVKEGDTLFIVEAMKTMNPIPAPRGGTVMEICVETASRSNSARPC